MYFTSPCPAPLFLRNLSEPSGEKQHPYLATAHFGGYATPFFVAPNDSLEIKIDGTKLSSLTEAVSMSAHKAETAYLLKKAATLGNHHMKIFPILDRETKLASIGRSLVYISFWATWYKPCIEEFPHENNW